MYLIKKNKPDNNQENSENNSGAQVNDENHGVWNHRKSLIQHCERSELRLHLSGQKLIKNAKNGPFWQVFENLKFVVTQCYQTG